jgi:hypothetical protein
MIDGTTPYVDTAAPRAAGYSGLVGVRVPEHLLDLLTAEVARDAETFRLAGDLDAALKATEVQHELLAQSSKLKETGPVKAKKAKPVKAGNKSPAKKNTSAKKTGSEVASALDADADTADTTDSELSLT